MASTLFYNLIIDGATVIYSEKGHFFDFDNLLDIVHVIGGYINIYLQWKHEEMPIASFSFAL